MSDATPSPRPSATTIMRLFGLLVVIAAFAFGAWALKGRFDLTFLKSLLAPLVAAQARAPIAFAIVYFGAYVAATGLCIPLEVPFALVAGALFGLAGGVVLSSFASIFGASLAFLGARFLLRGLVRRYFAPQLEMVNQGIARDGVFYLVNMRLLPVIPFTLCNILMGLTSMRLRVFFVVSQACMIFATIVFVNAGTQLPTLRRFGDILSPRLWLGLAALALLPWLGKAILYGMDALRHRTASAK